MPNKTVVPATTFKSLFRELIPSSHLRSVLRRCGPRRRCPPRIRAVELIHGLVFHAVAGGGTLARHVKQLTGKDVTDGALAQRRALLPWEIFEAIMGVALKPKADPKRHGEAFYHGLRLCGIDGSTFSIANTPQVKKQMRKARSRRGQAAFPKVGVALMVELGLHNPLAAAVGCRGESKMVLTKQVLSAQPQKSLLINDRYSGSPALLVDLTAEGERHFLVRVKANLTRCLLEVLLDGSALVEMRSGPNRRVVREILGRVQRGGGRTFTTVRLWTSLLDWRRHRAGELLALYGRRWEQEIVYKELKVDMRSTPCLQSHTPLTAMQEIAALILAYAVLVDYRVGAAGVGDVGVLRISFLKTLQVVQGLWQFLEVSADLLGPDKVRWVVRRALATHCRGGHSPTAETILSASVRQPVSSWPRLRKNTYRNGPVEYSVGEIYA